MQHFRYKTVSGQVQQSIDLNNDGFLDMIIGNFSGGMNYYKGSAAPPVMGINNPKQNNFSFSVFPNPAKNKIYLKFSADVLPELKEITIFNLYSQQLISVKKTFVTPVSIDISLLPPGVYICKVINGNIKKDESYTRFVISR